jgi:P22 coat protein - gene protein 5
VANNLLTMSYITNEALVVLENELVLANRVERQYSNEYAQTGAKVGNTVNIRRPPRYIGTYGPPLNVEDSNETYTPVALNYQFHVDVQFTTQDLALSMDMFKKRILRPQIAAVANRIDSDTAQYAFLNTATVVGAFGVQPASYKIFSDARAVLAAEACPTEGEKNCVLDPITMSAATDAIKGLFNPQVQLGEFVEKGLIARQFAGLDWWEDQNIPSFTTGTGQVNAAGTGVQVKDTLGTALLTTGWAGSGTINTKNWKTSTAVVNVGDTIQFTGVYPVNPQNRLQYGRTLKSFVVLPPGGFVAPPNGAASQGLTYGAATLSFGTWNPVTGQYSADGSGFLSLTIGEAIISGGQFQNVTAAPTTNTQMIINQIPYASTLTTTQSVVSPQGLVFHKYAYALAFADLPLPQGVEMAVRAYDDEDVGMSIRCVTQYTIDAANDDSFALVALAA